MPDRRGRGSDNPDFHRTSFMDCPIIRPRTFSNIIFILFTFAIFPFIPYLYDKIKQIIFSFIIWSQLYTVEFFLLLSLFRKNDKNLYFSKELVRNHFVTYYDICLKMVVDDTLVPRFLPKFYQVTVILVKRYIKIKNYMY